MLLNVNRSDSNWAIFLFFLSLIVTPSSAILLKKTIETLETLKVVFSSLEKYEEAICANFVWTGDVRTKNAKTIKDAKSNSKRMPLPILNNLSIFAIISKSIV